MKTILVTGGAGFIGSHFVDLVISKTDYKVIVLDNLTYAGKLENMTSFLDLDRTQFIKGDICDSKLISSIFEKNDIDYVVNFAAESHVDNSISESSAFIQTNIIGTHNLIDCAKKYWLINGKWKEGAKFIQISTDEVYGMLGYEGSFSESDCINPSSPYSASKASADILCLSYWKTFRFPVSITRSSNNYGPRQDTEKLIPKVISNALNNEDIPVYGKGDNVRDWIYVLDNCNAILLLLIDSVNGEIYNIGGDNEKTNIDTIKEILILLNKPTDLIKFVEDRLGHDFRYSVNSSKCKSLIGQFNLITMSDGLLKTIDYYKVQKVNN